MSIKIRTALLAVLALICTAGLLPALPAAGQAGAEPQVAPQATPIDREKLGMVVRDPWYDFGTYPGLPDQTNKVAQERMGQILAETGVHWVRFEFIIAGSDLGAFERNISRYDYFITEVAPRYDLKVLGLLSFGLVRDVDPLDPNYGIIAPTDPNDTTYGGGVNPYMHTWLDRALAISSRYKDKVAAYEVLNEQNRMPPSGAAVPPDIAARLHTKFYRLVKFPDPPVNEPWRNQAQIIVGGLHPRGTLKPGQSGYLSDIQYLRRLYGYPADGGAPKTPLEPFQEFKSNPKYNGQYPLDGLAYHPYPEEIRLSLNADIDLITGRLLVLKGALDGIGDSDRQIWITEIGYNAGFKTQTPYEQGQFLRAVFTTLAIDPDVARIFWFKYEDFPPAGGPDAQKWGIVHIPFTASTTCPGGACYQIYGQPDYRRPAYFVYRELAGLPNQRIHMPDDAQLALRSSTFR